MMINFIRQLLNVYSPKYETGGRFWPIVHYSIIFSLMLMHVIAIGLFGLKKLPLASSLTVPLPIVTLLFNEYCRKRFLSIFKSYPVEVRLKLSNFAVAKYHSKYRNTNFIILNFPFSSVFSCFFLPNPPYFRVLVFFVP